MAKTARKLLVELQKCYPATFESSMVNALKNDEDKVVCRAVLRNDEEEIQRIISNMSISSNGG